LLDKIQPKTAVTKWGYDPSKDPYKPITSVRMLNNWLANGKLDPDDPRYADVGGDNWDPVNNWKAM